MAKYELEILARVIMAETNGLDQELCQYNGNCENLLNEIDKVQPFFDADLLHKKSLFESVRSAFRSIAHSDEDFEDYNQEKILEKIEIREQLKDSLIANWYGVLKQKNALVDCSPLLQICPAGTSEKECDAFRMTLFQKGLSEESRIFQVAFDNGRHGYQVVLGEKAYWLGKQGDLREVKGDTRTLKGLKIYKCDNPEQYIGKEVRENGQCVKLVQEAAGAPDNPRVNWKAGPKVHGNVDIEAGTAIATFRDGIYPSADHGNHAAIYLCQDTKGMTVVEQYAKLTFIQKKTYAFLGGTSKRTDENENMTRDGDFYHVITSE